MGIFAQELTSGRNANVGSSKFQNIEAMQIDLRLFFLFFHSKLDDDDASGDGGNSSKPTLRPQLNLFDAVSTGLAAILGAGIFSVIAPAAGIAGPSLLISLLIAAFVAFCNAISSAQLAINFPRTGGTYEFGNKMLGKWWGFSAGWMFLVANTVGPGAIALSFGGYVNAEWHNVPPSIAAVIAAVAMTSINAMGIRRSVNVTDIVVILSILSLLAFVIISIPKSHSFQIFFLSSLHQALPGSYRLPHFSSLLIQDMVELLLL